jgi:hypothetical protein
MSKFTKMLNSFRRDCWGCDNKIGGKRTRCTCQPTRTERAKQKRQLKQDIKKGEHDE